MDWSPFVAGILDTFHDDRNVYMMLEYSPCGPLHLALGEPLPPAQVLFYFANIVCALEHLEKSGVANRDIKPANIVIGADGYLFLCDFGPAMQVPTEHPAKTFHWIGEGTAIYQAPEAVTLQGQPDDVRYGTAVDWWSAGVILFEMASGKIPFSLPAKDMELDRLSSGDGGMKIWEQIMAGPPTWPEGARVGRKLKALTMGLLRVDANERLGARGVADVMQDPWLATV